MEYCSLASGSCGNSHFIRTKEVSLLLDVGLSARYIREALRQIGSDLSEIEAIFLTHEHVDHVRGLRVLLRQSPAHLYLHPSLDSALEEILEEIDSARIHWIVPGEMMFHDLQIRLFEVDHDAAMTLGYTFSHEGKKMGIVTDVGSPQGLLEELSDCDMLVLESNHDERLVELGPYPYPLKRRILGEGGHLSNRHAASIIAGLFQERGLLKMVLLAHLSQKNNYPELALLTVEQELEAQGITMGQDLLVEVLNRRQISEIYRLI